MGGVQADKALAPFGAVGPLQKVHLSPDAGQLPGPGGLPVLLAHQIHFHSAVDADDVAHPADTLHRVDVVHIPGAEQLGLLVQPVVQLLGAHGQIPGGQSPVHLFPPVGQFARLPQLQKGVADGPRVAAQVPPVRLGQQPGHGEGYAAHPQGQHRPVGDLLHHQLGDLEVGFAGLPVAAQGQGLVLPLHHIVRLAQVDPVGAVHPLEPGQLLVDFKNHGAGALKDGAPGIVGDTQAAVPLSVRPGHRYEGHVAADVPVPVQIGQGPQHGGHKLYQPPALELALIVPDVPAVICKGLLLQV